VHPRHASVRALSVVDRPSLAPTPSETDAQLRSVLAAAERQLHELDGVHGEAIYGQVGPALTRWSASLDLLVVGSRGHGPVGRLVLRSTSVYLGRHAHCPLLVVATGGSEARPSAGRQAGPESLIRAGSEPAGAVR
jgi:nucleotide-binding universal stress UspA family protein